MEKAARLTGRMIHAVMRLTLGPAHQGDRDGGCRGATGVERVRGGREDADGPGHTEDGHERWTETRRRFLLTTRSGDEEKPVRLSVQQGLNQFNKNK